MHQRGKGKGGHQELDIRCRFGHGHPTRPAPLRTDHRNHHLNDGDNKGEDQGKVPEFSNHAPL